MTNQWYQHHNKLIWCVIPCENKRQIRGLLEDVTSQGDGKPDARSRIKDALWLRNICHYKLRLCSCRWENRNKVQKQEGTKYLPGGYNVIRLEDRLYNLNVLRESYTFLYHPISFKFSLIARSMKIFQCHDFFKQIFCSIGCELSYNLVWFVYGSQIYKNRCKIELTILKT